MCICWQVMYIHVLKRILCLPASLGLSAFVGKDHGVYFLMRGNVELEHDLELGQLKFE